MKERLRFLRRPSGAIGVAIVLFVIAVAIFGPLVAPHPPTQPVGVPLSGPSANVAAPADARNRRRDANEPSHRCMDEPPAWFPDLCLLRQTAPLS